MHEITRSAEVALKCLNAVVLVDVDLPYLTSTVEHLVAFAATVSKSCTAHAQKRLFMNFRCKFRHRRSIRRPRFPISVQNFGNLTTFYVNFCIFILRMSAIFLLPVCLSTDLESIPYATIPNSVISTKFEVDMTIHCRIIAFLTADTSLTLWPWLLNFGPWAVAVHGGSRDQPCYWVWRPYAYPFLSYEL